MFPRNKGSDTLFALELGVGMNMGLMDAAVSGKESAGVMLEFFFILFF
jgi:hypothetical protein